MPLDLLTTGDLIIFISILLLSAADIITYRCVLLTTNSNGDNQVSLLMFKD